MDSWRSPTRMREPWVLRETMAVGKDWGGWGRIGCRKRGQRNEDASKTEEEGTHGVLALPQHLLLSDVVDPQRLPNSGNQSSLEGHQARGHVVDLGLCGNTTTTVNPRSLPSCPSFVSVVDSRCAATPTSSRPPRTCTFSGIRSSTTVARAGCPSPFRRPGCSLLRDSRN